MKFHLALVSLLSATANAFVPISPTNTQSTTTLDATSRRGALEQGASLAAGVAFLVGAAPSISNADSRPMYLTEPTADFKANEQKAAEFKRKQLEQKKKFNDLLDKLVNEPEDEPALEKDLIELRRLVVETQGLPAGIKKEDMYKIIRTKKAKGFWPTNVEIAYQQLKNEVSFQQSPDTENKGEGSPWS